jgi:hypothetical protein
MTAILAVNNFGDTREGGVAGPLGGVIVLLLLVGTILLIRNMNARLRRLPRTFPPQARDPQRPADAGSSAVESTAEQPPPPSRADDTGGG